MHRLTATDTPMVRYTRTIFPSYATVPGFLEYYTQLEKKYVLQGLKRHMDVNDAYAHAYKHFIFTGTGIRTLIDIYVYNEYYKDSMDTEYIFEQYKILGIQGYEKRSQKNGL